MTCAVSEQDIADWMLHEQQAFQNRMNTGIYNNYCKPGKTGVVSRQFHGSEERENLRTQP